MRAPKGETQTEGALFEMSDLLSLRGHAGCAASDLRPGCAESRR